MKEHGKDLGVIVMEAVRKAEKPADGFLDGVRALADKTGAVLVVDEISSGFRMNTGGAHLVLGLKPDIAVFSKAIGNGYPIAAVIGKTDIMQSAQKTFISSTCWTERTGPAAAIATIRKHKAVDAGKHLMSIGQKVRDGWKECAGRHGLDIEIAGMYPMSHFTFKHEKHLSLKALLVQWMLEKGFLASTSFYAMYANKEEHVSLYLDAVDQVFAKISDAIRSNRIDEQLVGLPSGTGFKRLT